MKDRDNWYDAQQVKEEMQTDDDDETTDESRK